MPLLLGGIELAEPGSKVRFRVAKEYAKTDIDQSGKYSLQYGSHEVVFNLDEHIQELYRQNRLFCAAVYATALRLERRPRG